MNNYLITLKVYKKYAFLNYLFSKVLRSALPPLLVFSN